MIYIGLLSCNHPVDDMTALKKISKNLGTCILDLFLLLKYNYLHCFNILLDHAYINKHDLIYKLIIFAVF